MGKEKDKKVDQSGFQIDKKAVLEKVPLMLRGIVGQVIDFLNSADLTEDGKADISQLGALAAKCLPIAQKVLPYINVEKFIDWFVKHDFIAPEYQPTVKAALMEILKHVAEHK